MEENMGKVLLIGGSPMIDKLLNKPSFLDGIASQNYLLRSKWHNALILEQCRAYNTNFITIHGDESLDSLVKKVFTFLH
jgi:hypothetical protein